ncbi:MAG: UDP-3-O-(3-hydroxymyristoyl)glucosamine N-acyltransferase [Bacteroidetes bacterium]|nr:UDP-3-O-(3-hydroxymyristoyl)glucosamine N-acyltransferase [Bacteroidota bacterium]
MEFTAQQIADLLQGTVEGNPSEKVSRLSKIEEGTPGSLSFLANPAYTPYIYGTDASIVIVNKDFVPEKEVKSTLVRVENAAASFAKLLEVYNTIQRNKIGIEENSYIDPSSTHGDDLYLGTFAYVGKGVTLGNRVKIYPNAYVGDNCVIGDDTTLFPGVKIYSDCIIGKHVTLHSGVVDGGDGFGFQPNNGSLQKVAQIGNVIIEDLVEIGSNSTIDRATLGSTIIRKGVKLDNLIQIAHNVEIGENTVIAAQTGIAGSTKIGKNCMIGGQVGIVGHIQIADDVKIAAQSGVGSSVNTPGEILQGSPAFNIGDYKRTYVLSASSLNLRKKNYRVTKTLAEIRSTST